VQRFLPDVERTRRGAGWVFMAIGLGLVAPLCWSAMLAGRFSGTALVLCAPPVALMAWGLHLALRRKEVVEVDLDKRTFTVIRSGSRSGPGALDSLGPLSVKQRIRVTESGDERRTVIEYVVSAAVHSKIDLYVMDTPGKARQKMEVLAHAWRLPCQSYGGAVRGADDLNRPVHERLRGDREALTVTPLRPEWGVRIEPLSPGYGIVSTHRSWAPLKSSALLLLLTLFVLGISFPTHLPSILREVGGDLLEQVLAGLLGVGLLVLLWMLWRGVRDTFFPGTVRVTEGGVSYRGSRMAFDRIEEVIAGPPIEVVGDRRILRLAPSFCPPAATGAVAHELQRLILEVAPRSPGQT
jgi:hypothetical protein